MAKKRVYLSPAAHAKRVEAKGKQAQHEAEEEAAQEELAHFLRRETVANDNQFIDMIVYEAFNMLKFAVFCCLGGEAPINTDTHESVDVVSIDGCFGYLEDNKLSASGHTFTGRVYMFVDGVRVSFRILARMVIDHYERQKLNPYKINEGLLLKVGLHFSPERYEPIEYPIVGAAYIYRCHELFGFPTYKYTMDTAVITSTIHKSDWTTTLPRSDDGCYHVTSMKDFVNPPKVNSC